ncbi:MAG: excisionase family DNA binding protein [Rhodothermales bacterium]
METPMALDEKPDWYTIKDASAYLDIGEPTIYRWMRENKITYRKVGDSTRFLKEDLDGVVKVFPSNRNIQLAHELCPYCHHTEMAEGRMQSTGRMHFYPSKTKFWTYHTSDVETQARMCTRCGGISLMGDSEKLTALRKDKIDQKD